MYKLLLIILIFTPHLHTHEQYKFGEKVKKDLITSMQNMKEIIEKKVSPKWERYYNLPTETENEIYEILKKFNLGLEDKIVVKQHNINSCGSMGDYVLGVDQTRFNELTKPEKRFLIAHEILHYLGKHSRYKVCYYLSNHTSNGGYYRFARELEKEADIQAAEQFNCAAGGIAYFKRLQKKHICSTYDKHDPYTYHCVYAPQHPTFKERIAYLEPIAARQQRSFLFKIYHSLKGLVIKVDHYS